MSGTGKLDAHVDLPKHLRGPRCGFGRCDHRSIGFTTPQIPGRHPVQLGKCGLHVDRVRGRLRNRLAQVRQQQVAKPALCCRFTRNFGCGAGGSIRRVNPARQCRGVHCSTDTDSDCRLCGRNTICSKVCAFRNLVLSIHRISCRCSQHFACGTGRSRIRVAVSPATAVKKDD